MSDEQKSQNHYDHIIDELFKQSEEEYIKQSKFSVAPLSNSYYISNKLYPKSRLSIIEEKNVLKNRKIVSLTHRHQSNSQEREICLKREEKKEQIEIQGCSKLVAKPKMFEICLTNPQKEMETLKINLNNMRKENDLYLKTRENIINQKIRNKMTQKSSIQPLNFIPAKQKELISKTFDDVSIIEKYQNNKEELMIRRSISSQRCEPQKHQIQQQPIKGEISLEKIEVFSSNKQQKWNKYQYTNEKKRCRKMFKGIFPLKEKKDKLKLIYVNQINLLQPIQLEKTSRKKYDNLFNFKKENNDTNISKTERSEFSYRKESEPFKKDQKILNKLNLMKNRYHNFIGESNRLSKLKTCNESNDNISFCRSLTEEIQQCALQELSLINLERIKSTSLEASKHHSKKVVFSNKGNSIFSSKK